MSVTSADFSLGKSYNLISINSDILGNQLSNLQLKGLVGYDIAITIKNITTLQNTLLSSLPVGSPTDPTLYQYAVFQSQSGQKIVLALPWIVTATEINSTGVQIVVNNIGLSDIDNIRSALVAMGYTQFTITQL